VARGRAHRRLERERAGGVDDVLDAALVGPPLALVADRHALRAAADVGDAVAPGVRRREQAHEAGGAGVPAKVVAGALDTELRVEVAVVVGGGGPPRHDEVLLVAAGDRHLRPRQRRRAFEALRAPLRAALAQHQALHAHHHQLLLVAVGGRRRRRVWRGLRRGGRQGVGRRRCRGDGAHFQTFLNSSFVGNDGLCGSPLSKGCINTTPKVWSHHSRKKSADLMTFLFVGLGFGVGFATAIVVAWEIPIRKRS
jgi:hypothetical protein